MKIASPITASPTCQDGLPMLLPASAAREVEGFALTTHVTSVKSATRSPRDGRQRTATMLCRS